MVIKRDGRRQPFDRLKLDKGIERALEKRPVSTSMVEQIANDIEDLAIIKGKETREISTSDLGELVLEKLYTIVENRTENGLPIIITTRFDKQGLIERFSQSQDEQLVEAIISKLYQMCYGITLKEKELVSVGKLKY